MSTISKSGIRTLILDVDSTLTTLEGIDWLAERRGSDLASRIADLTELAMSGKVSLDEVFALRLDVVRPTVADVRDLAQAYIDSLSTGASKAIGEFGARNIRTILVSGGIRQAILPLASMLGIDEQDVYAVPLLFDDAGEFTCHDEGTPLSRQRGKLIVAESLSLERRIAAVGDGMTDLEMKPAVDWFIAFTGVARREEVVLGADAVVSTFMELQELVLG
ncbi:MAG TPA: HAD-IB family phosphatase [Gemmatimonadaceae bacterium]|nr:HAD-IB family phosphatase [Gemmatimonadaceae bacterium]